MITIEISTSITITGSRRGSFPRFNSDAITQMWADSIVDDAGYASPEDLILSRHEHVDRLFPNSDELRARGVDVEKLAACIEQKLIVLEHFGDTVENLSVEELNGALEHLLEGNEAWLAHPDDALDRAMHHQGCCSCH